jgi:RNA polymerase sigma-70 factor (ECF subfamily)
MVQNRGPVPEDHANDFRLVHGVLRGEPEAEDEFIERMQCVPLILDHRNATLGSPFHTHELEDLVQEVLSTVWRRLDAFEGRSSLQTWCHGVCLNLMKNALRKKRHAPRLIAEEPEGSVPVPLGLERSYEPDLEFDRFEFMYECLHQLDERPATVIQLKIFEDLTFQQIGARLAIPANSAKTHFYRGLQRLRAMMASAQAV